MEVIVRILKVNPWTGLTKWPTTFDYVGPQKMHVDLRKNQVNKKEN